MQKEGKVITIISVITIAIIGFGVYFFSRPPKTVDQNDLSSENQGLLVKDDSARMTASNEKAILVEFGDFQCPACGAYHPLVKKLVEEKSENLTFIFRHFPLLQHPNARPASYAAEAAGLQGKFWEMYDLIYENQPEWSDEKNATDIFIKYAQTIGLDINQFKDDMDSSKVKDKVSGDYSDGTALKVNSTPSFFLNGQKITLPGSYEAMKALIEDVINNSPIVENVEEESFHTHFDLKVYINGNSIDFSQDKYQSSHDNELNEFIHMHDGNGEVVHVHKKDVLLGDFFESLKMSLTKDCLKTDSGNEYCSSAGDKLKMFVNGQENKDFENYKPQDLDRILITFGSENDEGLQKQVENVTDLACIYSEKCPERGSAPTEECVGGLGTNCVEE